MTKQSKLTIFMGIIHNLERPIPDLNKLEVLALKETLKQNKLYPITRKYLRKIDYTVSKLPINHVFNTLISTSEYTQQVLVISNTFGMNWDTSRTKLHRAYFSLTSFIQSIIHEKLYTIVGISRVTVQIPKITQIIYSILYNNIDYVSPNYNAVVSKLVNLKMSISPIVIKTALGPIYTCKDKFKFKDVYTLVSGVLTTFLDLYEKKYYELEETKVYKDESFK